MEDRFRAFGKHLTQVNGNQSRIISMEWWLEYEMKRRFSATFGHFQYIWFIQSQFTDFIFFSEKQKIPDEASSYCRIIDKLSIFFFSNFFKSFFMWLVMIGMNDLVLCLIDNQISINIARWDQYTASSAIWRTTPIWRINSSTMQCIIMTSIPKHRCVTNLIEYKFSDLIFRFIWNKTKVLDYLNVYGYGILWWTGSVKLRIEHNPSRIRRVAYLMCIMKRRCTETFEYFAYIFELCVVDLHTFSRVFFFKIFPHG